MMNPTPGLGWTPIPDPTLLTQKATDAAKDELRREIYFLREVLDTRFHEMDKAVLLLQQQREAYMQGWHAQVHEAVSQALTLTQERFMTVDQKFRGVEIQFIERDTRTEQASTATKIAVDAALQAQKEAVGAQNANIAQAMARIEATATKQIEQLITLLQTTAGASNDKIDDLKQRLALIEGRTAGITVATSTQQGAQTTQLQSSSYVIAIIGLVVGALIGVAGVIMAVLKP